MGLEAGEAGGRNYLKGTTRFDEVVLPSDAVGDNNVDVDSPISQDKLKRRITAMYAQDKGADVVTHRRVVHIAADAGQVNSLTAVMSVASTGDSTVVTDLLKNGSTVLSSTAQLDSGDAAFTGEAIATINPSLQSYIALDVFEVSVTATIGTGNLGEGLGVAVVFDEDPGT